MQAARGRAGASGRRTARTRVRAVAPAEDEDDKPKYDRRLILEKLETIVRVMVRTFYDDLSVIIVDALIRHRNEMMRDTDLARRLGIQESTVRTKLRFLFEQNVIMRDTRNDARSQHYVYYIDFATCLDMIRYRLHVVTEALTPQQRTKQELWCCSSCSAQFRDEDWLELVNKETGDFVEHCPRCKCGALERINAKPETASHRTLMNFKMCMAPLREALAEIEALPFIPRIQRSTFQYDKDGVVRVTSAKDRARLSASATMGPMDFTLTVEVSDHTGADKGSRILDGPLPPCDAQASRMEVEDDEADKEQPPWLRSKYERNTAAPSEDVHTDESLIMDAFSEQQFGMKYDDYVRLYYAQLREQQHMMLTSNEQHASEDMNVEESGSETVDVNGQKVPLHSVTESDVARMSATEYEQYFHVRARFLGLE